MRLGPAHTKLIDDETQNYKAAVSAALNRSSPAAGEANLNDAFKVDFQALELVLIELSASADMREWME